MELRSVGRFVLVAPLEVPSRASRLYLARQLDDPEDTPPAYVAKLLLLGRSGSEQDMQRAQFEHEARLLKAFNHPSIPAVHGGSEQDGVSYLVMELIDGVDLAHLLGHDVQQPRALAPELAVYVMGQLAEAVRYAHQFEIIDEEGEAMALDVLHRDICPANVLVSRDGDVLLTDFGAARSRWLDPRHDAVETGHKAYMAPERVTGTAAATVQSDLFAMATMLWEMLRGERCFRAEDDLKTMDAIARFEISHPSRRVTGLSSKLGEVLRKNLDRDPARRYDSAYHMLQRLSQAPEAKAAERARLELAGLVAEMAPRRSQPAAP